MFLLFAVFIGTHGSHGKLGLVVFAFLGAVRFSDRLDHHSLLDSTLLALLEFPHLTSDER